MLEQQRQYHGVKDALQMAAENTDRRSFTAKQLTSEDMQVIEERLEQDLGVRKVTFHVQGGAGILLYTTNRQLLRIAAAGDHPGIVTEDDAETRNNKFLAESGRFDHPMILQPLYREKINQFWVDVSPEVHVISNDQANDENIRDTKFLESELVKSNLYFFDTRHPHSVRVHGMDAWTMRDNYIAQNIGYLEDGKPVVLDLGAVATKEKVIEFDPAFERVVAQSIRDSQREINRSMDYKPYYEEAQQDHREILGLEKGQLVGGITQKELQDLPKEEVDITLKQLVEEQGFYRKNLAEALTNTILFMARHRTDTKERAGKYPDKVHEGLVEYVKRYYSNSNVRMRPRDNVVPQEVAEIVQAIKAGHEAGR